MKKIFAVSLTAALALALAACGGTAVTNNAAAADTSLNEDFPANDTLGNDTFGNDATVLDTNATDGNVAGAEGNAF